MTFARSLALPSTRVCVQLKNIFDASISAVTWSLIGRKCRALPCFPTTFSDPQSSAAAHRRPRVWTVPRLERLPARHQRLRHLCRPSHSVRCLPRCSPPSRVCPFRSCLAPSPTAARSMRTGSSSGPSSPPPPPSSAAASRSGFASKLTFCSLCSSASSLVSRRILKPPPKILDCVCLFAPCAHAVAVPGAQTR